MPKTVGDNHFWKQFCKSLYVSPSANYVPTLSDLAAQIRNVLSSCLTWEANDSNFLGGRFFKNILQVFNNNNNNWAFETITWWNA